MSASTSTNEKTSLDVISGCLARAGSQASIHPLDTLKVRLQAMQRPGPGSGSSRGFRVHAAGIQERGLNTVMQGLAQELAVLYKGVFSAAAGAGIIIGTYFAFYSTTKRHLRKNTDLPEGSIAFASGATAAVGSSVVKVPIAVCIRSVQAGVYQNVFQAARTITSAAGPRGLFTGFLPTLLEDVPDMAVKFAVYESLRAGFRRVNGGDDPSTWQDLLMGGSAGAAAAAATTPVDVVKTRMMCSASQRPTIVQAVQSVVAEGGGWRPFFRGVGPRAVSNGLNSAIFFCFFEAIRRMLIARQQQEEAQESVARLVESHNLADASPPTSGATTATTASITTSSNNTFNFGQSSQHTHEHTLPSGTAAGTAGQASHAVAPSRGRGTR